MKVAVFYPWGELLDRKSGASQRTGLLLDYLEDQCDEIWVLSNGIQSDIQNGNIRYSFYQEKPLNPLLAVIFRLISLFTLGKDKDQDLMFRYHHKFRFDQAFVSRIEKMADWADAIILEYTFWASIIVKAKRHKNIKVIITDHDVVSSQITKSDWLRKITLGAETGALKSADHAICVSENDQKAFKLHGVDAEVIPHAIDIGNYQLPLTLTKEAVLDELVIDELDAQYGIELFRGSICLFVGSRFAANVRAVEVIHEIAKAISSIHTDEPINFFVVGGCCKPKHDGNFHSLGKVDAEVLKSLYQISDLVLIPLQSGTGASIKTIEAMAYGKPILGTTVGFRGYPVSSGVHCLVSDDLSSYPEIIADLINNPEERHKIGKNAREFAKSYDYRVVYSRYAELLGLQ